MGGGGSGENREKVERSVFQCHNQNQNVKRNEMQNGKRNLFLIDLKWMMNDIDFDFGINRFDRNDA